VSSVGITNAWSSTSSPSVALRGMKTECEEDRVDTVLISVAETDRVLRRGRFPGSCRCPLGKGKLKGR
jgi:hypothetical protein